MKSGFLIKKLVFVFLLIVQFSFSQKLTTNFELFDNHKISCLAIQTNTVTGEVYFGGDAGIFVIKNGEIQQKINKKRTRNLFVDNKNQMLYASLGDKLPYQDVINEKLLLFNIKSHSKKMISVPIELVNFIVRDDYLLNFGRKANNYEVVSLKDSIITYQEYFTYLDDNNKLKSTKNKNVDRQVDLQFRNLNGVVYLYEGMYVNSQENKLKGIYSINNSFRNIKPDFAFLSNKIIRSFNYSKGNFIAATKDSIFILNQEKIINRFKIPENNSLGLNKNQLPFDVFEYEKNNFIILFHKKNSYIYSLYKYDLLTSNIERFNYNKEVQASNFIFKNDKNGNIWLAKRLKGLKCIFNSKDNFIINHQFENININELAEYKDELLVVSNKIPNYGSEKLTIPINDDAKGFQITKKNKRYFLFDRIDKKRAKAEQILIKSGKLPPDKDTYNLIGNYIDVISDTLTYVDSYLDFSLINENDGSYISQPKPKGFYTLSTKILDDELFISSLEGLEILDLKSKTFKKEKFVNQKEIKFVEEQKENTYLLIRKNTIEIVDKSTLKVILSVPNKTNIKDVLVNGEYIWTATENNGIVVYNKALEKIRIINNPKIFKKVNKLVYNTSLDSHALYAVTDNGLILINIDKIINREILNNEFKVGVENNILNITPTIFTTPDIYSFKYKVNDENSKDFKKNISLDYLEHGKHEIEIEYFLNNKWTSYKTRTVHVSKPWNKRKASIIIVFLVLLFLISLFLILFANSQTRRRKEIEYILNEKIALENKLDEIQNAIAMDLHDNFGNRIAGINSSIGILQEMYKNEKMEDEKFKKFMSFLDFGVKQLDLDINALIWSNEPSNNNLEQVVERLEKYSNKVTKSIKTTIQINKEIDYNYKLPRLWNRQILLIVKELINNAAVHANSKNIEILVLAKKNKFKLSCSDTGIGFDANSLKKVSGLSNLSKRAESMECEIVIHSEINKGTTVTLQGAIPK